MNHPLLLDAILLNNEGAQFLHSGDLLAANHLLQQAVLMLKYAPQTTLASCHVRVRHLEITTTHNDSVMEESCSKDEYGDGSMFVFSRPFLLLPTTTTSHLPDQEDSRYLFDAVSGCLLFNMALLHHLFGIRAGTSASLRRAQELYHAALAVHPRIFQCSCGRHGARAFPKTNALLHCLILNNLAHVLHDLCDYTASTRCLNFVLRIFCHTGCLDDRNLLTNKDAQGIKLYVICRHQHVMAKAA